MLRLINH